jgi:hypothetical protein
MADHGLTLEQNAKVVLLFAETVCNRPFADLWLPGLVTGF